jgi:integrase
LAIAEVPLQKIKELVGHKSIQTTLLYAHLQPDHLREEVTRLPFAGEKEAEERVIRSISPAVSM